MYDKLKAEVAKQSTESSANCTRIKLVYKMFGDTPMMKTYDEHLTFYRSQKATFDAAVGAGFDDSFLAWLLLNSNDDPVWLVASTITITSDTPINKY